ncbi:MAG: hypothetical protein ACI9OJ_004670 [Myxococcota bacterium]
MWDQFEATFQRNLAALNQFVEREHHARIQKRHVETVDGEDIQLGTWVSHQRNLRKNGKLSDERIAALEAISGWTWSAR